MSIPEAMWMTVATLTTVGFGDVVPTSCDLPTTAGTVPHLVAV